MNIRKTMLVPVLLGASAAALVAGAVEVNAKGGVIPNDASADVTIVAGGEDGDITLGADATAIKTLKDSTTAATVQIGAGQSLTVSGALTVDGSASANLTLSGAGSASFGGITINNNANVNLSCGSVAQTGFITMGGTSGNRGYMSIYSPISDTGRLELKTGILDIHEGADISKGVSLGDYYSASCWQDGGILQVLGFASTKQNAYIGGVGWFHYHLSGGELKFKDHVYWSGKTGPATKPTSDKDYPCVILDQTGGKTSGAEMSFPCSSYEKAMWIMRGGEASHAGYALYMANAGVGATGALILDGPVTSCWKYVDTSHNADSRVDFVLNDGVLHVGAMAFGGDDSKSYVSFNGGTIKTLSASTDNGLFGHSRYPTHSADYANSPDRVTIYSGGMKVDVAESGRTIHESLKAPSGGGVSGAASLPTTDFDGPPMVEIIGDGYGAVAYAEYDRSTKKITGLRIACPGNDYTWAKAVYMRAYMASGNAHTVRTNDCTVVESQEGGGLELLGGSLNMKVANEYTGATILRGGTLRPNVVGAIPPGSSVYIATNAVLDLMDISGAEISLGSGAGEITRGKAVHVGLWKAKAEDLVAGNVLTVKTGSQGSANAGHLEIADGATFTVDDASKLDENSAYVIVKSDFAIAGELPTVVDMPDGWRLKFSKDKKSINLSKKHGLMLIVH